MSNNVKVGAIVSAIVGILLALLGVDAAGTMGALQSQAGNTVAEAFYNAFGSWAIAVLGLLGVMLAVSVIRMIVQGHQVEILTQQQRLMTILCEAQRFDDPSERSDYVSGALASTPFPLSANSTAPSQAASWYADPTGRHQMRFWDGSSWTSKVSNDRVVSEDPVGV